MKALNSLSTEANILATIKVGGPCRIHEKNLSFFDKVGGGPAQSSTGRKMTLSLSLSLIDCEPMMGMNFTRDADNKNLLALR